MQVDDICKKLKPVLGEKIDRLWSLYQTEDSEGKKWVHVTLLKLLAEHLGETYEGSRILMSPPPEEVSSGEYPLGRVWYGDEFRHTFGLREEEWIQHVGIFGRSGSGKTNCAFLILRALARKGKPFLVFDWKRNYRDLIPRLPGLLVFTVGRDVSPFRFNPLIPPPETPPRVWLKKLNEVTAHTYYLGEGVKYLLQQSIDKVYNEYGVYGGKTNTYPTMEDVLAHLENQPVKGRQAEWMSSTLRTLGVLCFGEFGAVLNVRDPFPLEELLRRNVILELDALTESDKTFLIETLLLWLHHFRLAQGKREEFKHALVIEEAHHVLLRKKQEMTGEETITDIILREIRELGESIILIDQHPSLISKPALGNTYATIGMNLKHRDDVNAVANAMLIESGEKKYLGELPTGCAIARLQGRWPKPFLVAFPLVRVKKGTVADADVAQAVDELALGNPAGSLESRLLAERANAISEALKQEAKASEAGRPGFLLPGPQETGSRAPQSQEKGTRERCSEDRKALLEDVRLHAYDCLKDRYARLGWSFHRGNRARDALIADGLMEAEEVRRPDGMVKLLALTARGWKEGGGEDGASGRSWRRGGLEHGYWVEEVARALRARGWTVTVEKRIGAGKTVDIEAKKDGRRVAFEVETGKSDAVANILKDLKHGYDAVFSVALDRQTAERIRTQVVAPGPADGGRLAVFDVGRLKEELGALDRLSTGGTMRAISLNSFRP